MPPIITPGGAPSDARGIYLSPVWDPLSDSGMVWRGVNASGGLAYGSVVLYGPTGNALIISASGEIGVTTPTVSTAALTVLASSTTSVQFFSTNAARRGLLLTNTDVNTVRIKYGATASASSFTVAIPQDGYWEMPTPIYTGRIDVIWDGDGAGSLFATEL